MKTQRAICDRSGFEFPIGEMRREWNGLLVHKSFWEPRHPQDMLRPRTEGPPPRLTRPESPDVFLSSPVLPGDL
jgi:hypothetical protein